MEMKIYMIQCDICGKYGITRVKNIITPSTNIDDVIARMEFNLCKECLIDLYKMINEWKNQRSEENEFSS